MYCCVQVRVWLYWYINPDKNASDLARSWEEHPVLRDYPRPLGTSLAAWYVDFKKELYTLLKGKV